MKKLFLFPLILLFQYSFSQYFGVGATLEANIKTTSNPLKIRVMDGPLGKNTEAVLMSKDSITQMKTMHIFRGTDLKAICIKSRIYAGVEQPNKWIEFFNKDCVMITKTNWKKPTDAIIYNVELKNTNTNIAMFFFEITPIN